MERYSERLDLLEDPPLFFIPVIIELLRYTQEIYITGGKGHYETQEIKEAGDTSLSAGTPF